jgi:hypothetical protein
MVGVLERAHGPTWKGRVTSERAEDKPVRGHMSASPPISALSLLSGSALLPESGSTSIVCLNVCGVLVARPSRICPVREPSFSSLSGNPDLCSRVLCTNRDEYLARPTAPAHFHDFGSVEQSPSGTGHVLSGRDIVAGGTWLGITRSGHFAML